MSLLRPWEIVLKLCPINNACMPPISFLWSVYLIWCYSLVCSWKLSWKDDKIALTDQNRILTVIHMIGTFHFLFVCNCTSASLKVVCSSLWKGYEEKVHYSYLIRSKANESFVMHFYPIILAYYRVLLGWSSILFKINAASITSQGLLLHFVSLYKYKYLFKYIGMAVPQTTEPECRDWEHAGI